MHYISSTNRMVSIDDMANIPTNYSRLIGRELNLQIRDLPKLLKFTGLTGEQLMRDETFLTARQQIQILHNGLQISNSDIFGLRLGKRFTPSTHGLMGFLASSSPNLLTAFRTFQTFLPTRFSFTRIEIQVSPTMMECFVSFNIELHPKIYRTVSEIAVVTLLEYADFIVGRRIDEVIVSFMHEKPEYSSVYSDYIAGSYQFSCPNLLIQIPIEICQIANASANHDSYMFAMQQCQAMLTQLNAHTHSNTYQVQKMMLSGALGELSEEDAAAALFISKRTLARRLEKEGTHYREIRDKILSQQAMAYLKNSSMSVEAIASLLNYHDSANFRRAFKRWLGLSPSEYRQQLKTSPKMA